MKNFNFKDPSFNSIELEITFRCNYFCPTCNRMVGRFVLPESDMTMDQIERFGCDLQKAVDRGQNIEEVHVMGGEPLKHPQFTEIFTMLDDFRKRGLFERLYLVTNGEAPYPPEIDHIEHEKQCVPIHRKKHSNFYQAPIDLGVPYRKCNIPKGCGIALNAWGYWPCGPGSSVARLLQKPEYARYELPENLDT